MSWMNSSSSSLKSIDSNVITIKKRFRKYSASRVTTVSRV